jgi:DNA-binding XRE family transcriptional regulator
LSISDRGAKFTIDRTEPLNAKIITTPKGERLAILSADDYEDMRDALIHAEAMADFRAGRDEGVTLDEMQALLDAPTPLAFWRAKRGMTQAALAKAAKTTQPHIADLESGKHGGSLEVMARIAVALRIKVDELVMPE